MDLVVTMRPKPGDKEITKATIKMYDETGMDQGGQVLLEGETAETQLTVPPGGYCIVRETSRSEVFDAEQKSAVPLGTAERESNIDSPNTPSPKTEREMRDHEAKYAEKHQKEMEEKKKREETERAKYYDKDGNLKPGVDAKDMRMREDAERREKADREHNEKNMRDQGYKADTSKPGDTKLDDKAAEHGKADLSKSVSSSAHDKDDKMDPTKRK